jgi:hypothetical protein
VNPFTRSLRRMLATSVACTVALVLVMSVAAISALRTIARETEDEIEVLDRGGRLAGALVATALDQIRAGEKYLLTPSSAVKAEFLTTGDEAYAIQARLRGLPHLDGHDRALLNLVGDRQAELEISYSIAHALADIPDQGHRRSDQPAGAQRRHRSGPGGRAGTRFCGGCRRSAQAGRLERHRRP